MSDLERARDLIDSIQRDWQCDGVRMCRDDYEEHRIAAAFANERRLVYEEARELAFSPRFNGIQQAVLYLSDLRRICGMEDDDE
jgi:hypothetical protein